MDVRGITWVGNVYQRFENMCLDVEELMFQDTVQFVEDQVQSVGLSVRRLVQDLLLPPLSSPESETTLPFRYAVEKGPDDGPSEADSEQQLTRRTFKVTSEISEGLCVAPLIHVRDDADDSCRPSGDYVRATCSGLRSRKRHGGAKSDVSIGTSSVSSDFVDGICEASSDQTAEIATASIDEEVTDLLNEVVLAESTIGNNKNETEIMFSGGVSAGPSASDTYLSYKVYTGGLSRKQEVRYDEYGDDEIWKTFNWNLETDIKTGSEDRAETVEQQHSDKSSLEETVVLVNQDDLQFLSQRESNNKRSEKKTRQSLYSRMRSGRKHEYKQLVLHQDEPSASKSELPEKLPSGDSCEFEWELL